MRSTLADGSYTLPIKQMFKQMIGDAKPQVFLTTGTAGGVYCSMHLGDVMARMLLRCLLAERRGHQFANFVASGSYRHVYSQPARSTASQADGHCPWQPAVIAVGYGVADRLAIAMGLFG